MNFASQPINLKIPAVNKKYLEVQGTRDLFGRLLYLGQELNIELKLMLQYPLTPVPLSLADVTGNKHKTAKSALTKYLEKDIEHNSPEHIDVFVIDAMYFIRSLPLKIYWYTRRPWMDSTRWTIQDQVVFR